MSKNNVGDIIDKKTKDELYKNQTNELYASLGKFVVKFEQVCHTMRTAIIFILDDSGLKNQQLSNIMLSDHTAEPLRSILHSLIGETVQLNENEKKIIKNIFARIQQLTRSRNDIVHSMWFIGWRNKTMIDFAEASGYKLHKNKDGSATKIFKYEKVDFEELSKEAEILSELVFRLYVCIISKFCIEKNFDFDKNSNVIKSRGLRK